MRKRKLDPAIVAAYWAGALVDSLESGDPYMLAAAKSQLRTVGLDIRPIRRRGRRAGFVPSRAVVSV